MMNAFHFTAVIELMIKSTPADQFVYLTSSTEAKVTASQVSNTNHP